ncbi:hypothetical protein CMV30_18565 [Nibricoccus aquaticus]|uniref:Gfo/Idh/MocA-like oxidoreductase N-terminal domain-containing protein n=1 Tax=Nibricoccus aquaticus TaxID=2576891 RepID=A0A290QAU4_9BACT|nr:Gfo/Idh/MocA family oxidoreductase [Nibricoccus aquaticus]ATC65789.1 hypothetical protein CMV30_18565 [Nibricoccus aquaticus]
MSPCPPLAIGFVGLGFGATVAQALMKGPACDLFRVTAACDADPVKLQDFCGRYGIKGYVSLDDLLGDESIPVVGLFSGPVGRSELLLRIIRAGKDVMTTKPFELDPVAARDVLAEAQRLGRVIHLNSPPAEPPQYVRQILAWQREFDLGRPVSCRGEMLISYREKADGRWFDDPKLCPAAPLFRIGIYSLSDLLRLFGRVQSVQVMSSRLFTGRPTADNAELGLLFENGALGSIHASFCVDDGQHYANSLTLHYERGTIHRNVFPVAYGEAERTSRLRLTAVRGKDHVISQEWQSAEVSGEYAWSVFHDAVTKRRVLEMPFEEIMGTVEVVAAMARAERSQKTELV